MNTILELQRELISREFPEEQARALFLERYPDGVRVEYPLAGHLRNFTLSLRKQPDEVGALSDFIGALTSAVSKSNPPPP